MTTEYVSSVGGFAAGGDSANSTAYVGPVGALGGSPSFQVAALFLPTDASLSPDQTLWQNTTGMDGWRLGIRRSTVVGVPPNALDVFVDVNGVQDARGTVLNAQPGVPMLVHATIADVGQDHGTALFVNGLLVNFATVAGVVAPSPGGVAVGVSYTGGDPATQTRILGVMYHEGASPTDVTPASFYTACREAKDMVWGLDTVGGAPVSPNSDWTNRYSVRTDISGSPVAPATWMPSTGMVNLTRTTNGEQALDVRAHKNLDWLAAVFAVAAPPPPS